MACFVTNRSVFLGALLDGGLSAAWEYFLRVQVRRCLIYTLASGRCGQRPLTDRNAAHDVQFAL